MASDPSTIVKLLLAHRGMLLGYIAAIVRDSALAEDVFQDTTVCILQKSEQLRDPAEFPVWARSIARLESLAALRKQRNMPRGLDSAVLDSLESHWRIADTAPDAEAIEALRGCTGKLPPRVRELVELRYARNISGKALAEHFKQPVNTIYVTLSRAHRSLADCVKLRLAGRLQPKEVKYG